MKKRSFRAAVPGGRLWVLVAVALSVHAHAATVPPGFQDFELFNGLDRPTAFRFAPDGSVFVSEQRGVVKRFSDLQDTTPAIVADLTTNVLDNWDRGLLSLAIHPQYPAVPYIYVIYTVDAPLGGTPPVYNDVCPTVTSCPSHGRLSRFQVAGDVMIGPEEILLEDWCGQFPSHSMGDLLFGADGALYMSAGDGSSFIGVDYGQLGNVCGDDPLEGGAMRAQDVYVPGDPCSLNGAVIRVDPESGLALPDNPLFAGATNDDDRIIAYGLRNPFRLTFRPDTSEIWVADVGWARWEEIHRIVNPVDAVVENFGWPCYESTNRQSGYDTADLPICESLYATPGSVTDPFFAYHHDDLVAPGNTNKSSSCISGLAFYEDGAYPTNYHGALFFADYARRAIFVMFQGTNGLPDPSTRMVFATDDPWPVDLQIGPGGHLYYSDILGGSIHAIRYFSSNQPPIAVISASVLSGSLPLQVQLSATNSYDPNDSDAIRFAWDLDGDGQYDDSTQSNLTHVIHQPGYHNIRLRVLDSLDAEGLQGVLVVAGNSPPVPFITEPAPTNRWKVGEVLSFVGGANDLEEGLLPSSAMDWRVELHHCHADNPSECHTHFIQTIPGVSSGQFTAVDHEFPSFLEFHLEATDSGSSWWIGDWTRRRRIAFNNDLRGGLTNVPVMVRLDSTRIDYSRAGVGGAGLRFVDKDENMLPAEIELWQPGGESFVWVRVPRVEADSHDDYMWMYYGNTNSLPAPTGEDVWSNEFSAVWHMDDLADATGRGLGGTNHGTAVATGLVGLARSFDGVDDYVSVDFHPSMSFPASSNFTIEAWIYDEALPYWWEGIVGRYDTVSPWYGLWLTAWGEYILGNHENAHIYGGAAAAGWHYVCGIQSGSEGIRRLYVDGEEVAVGGAESGEGTDPLYIGATVDEPGEFFAGLIDEVRLSRIARDADWISAQYDVARDAFLSFGPEETQAEGLTGETSVRVDPLTQEIEFDANVAGVTLDVNGEEDQVPFTREVIVGSANSVGAPRLYTDGAHYHFFTAWSDQGARNHVVLADSNLVSLTAFYADTASGLDFDGDDRADVALFDAATGSWYLEGDVIGPRLLTWGPPGSIPVPGDYDGDDIDDLAAFTSAGGQWTIQFSGGGSSNLHYGAGGSWPVPADYDADGKTDVAVYWPPDGTWYIRGSLGTHLLFQVGGAGAVPAPADFDRDGKVDPAAYWPAGGKWIQLLSADNWRKETVFGFTGSVPVPCDYDGDGRADLAVYWPPSGNWLINNSIAPARNQVFGWLDALPTPADGNWDGLAEPVVYWPQAGRWYRLRLDGVVETGSQTNAGMRPADLQYQLNRLGGLLP